MYVFLSEVSDYPFVVSYMSMLNTTDISLQLTPKTFCYVKDNSIGLMAAPDVSL
jgi:hypothetical protein